MRPKQRDPGYRRDDNRQQYSSRPHVFCASGKLVEIGTDTVNNRLNSAIENFHYHHQKHRTDEKYASYCINIQETGDDNRDDSGDPFLAKSGFIEPCGTETFP